MSRTILATLAAVFLLTPLLPGAAHAAEPDQALYMQRHSVVDREGYGEPIEAISLLLPAEWRAQSRIAWLKPCSADELHDILLRAQSPDGRVGFQILPGLAMIHLEMRFRPEPGLPPLPPEAMWSMEQERERERQQRLALLRGSNCYEGRAADARAFLDRFIADHRPSDTRIIEAEALPALAESLAQVTQGLRQTAAGVNIPGMGQAYGFDAQRFRLRYNTSVGPIDEDVAIGALGMRFTSAGLGFDSVTELASTVPIYTVWAPAGRLADFAPMFDAIGRSVHVNPRWQAANAKTRAEIARIRREGAAERHQIWMETQREISEMRMESWQNQQESRDRMAEDFIDYIRGIERVTDPSTGSTVEVPAGQFDRIFSDGNGGYIGVAAGQDPNVLYPGQSWHEMTPAP